MNSHPDDLAEVFGQRISTCARAQAVAGGHTKAWRWLEPNTARISGLNLWTMPQPAVRSQDRDLGRVFKAIPEKVPIL